MRQVRMVREEMEQLDYTMAGDLREEFARAITKELSIESNDSTQLIENVNRELLDLVTRSNEYHSYRYFEMVQEVKQIRENCETLKKSIGMVDAELSDVKETVEHLTDEVGHNTTDIGIITDDIAEVKDDMYHELDRDYYDLKDYVKRQMHRHQKKYHHLSYYDENTTSTSSATAAAAPDTTSNREDVIQFTAEQYADPVNEIIPEGQIHSQNRRNEDEHLIIIDENTFHSDTDDEDVIVSHT
jgi:chromosome segregation ATPase